jgi:hypothetical protein
LQSQTLGLNQKAAEWLFLHPDAGKKAHSIAANNVAPLLA